MRRNRIFVIFVVCHHERHLGTLHNARTSTLRCAEFQSSQPPGVGAAEPDPQKVSFCSVLCFSCTRSVLLGCLVCSCSVCGVSVVVCYKVCQVCSCSARTIREVSGPGPSGVKSHTGFNANAATAPTSHQEKYFQTTQRNIFGVANILDKNVQDSCLLQSIKHQGKKYATIA